MPDYLHAYLQASSKRTVAGQAVPIKLASLIHELSKEIKLEDLAKRLPYEEVQLKDSLELLKLPDDFGRRLTIRGSCGILYNDNSINGLLADAGDANAYN